VLDYRLPARWAGGLASGQITVGTVVRIPLQGRRVRGWIIELHRTAPAGLTLREISKISGHGPGADLLELAAWAAHRWAGRRLTFVRAATPPRTVAVLSAPRVTATAALGPAGPAGVSPAAAAGSASAGSAPVDAAGPSQQAGRDAFERLEGRPGIDRIAVLRWPPGTERLGFALAAVARGPALLLTPAQHDADVLARALQRAGHRVGRHPGDWAAGAAGTTMVGSRAAAWAPVAGLRTVVVFDEHDERYQDERTPTWHARDLLVERARRTGAALLLISPVPSLEAAQLSAVDVPSRRLERAGWPLVEVIDRRAADPRQGLWSPTVVEAVRHGGRVVVVHNRTGRARLLACTRCGELCRCPQCGGPLHGVGEATAERRLRCARGDHEQPEVCRHCGATRLAVLRPGVGRVRQELEALIGEPVHEVTGAARPADADAGEADEQTRVWVGTSAALHRARRADRVVVLDLDQELLAPRFRAAERTLSLLALAARVLGPRRRDGRLLVQTRQPDHEVVQSVVHADPGRWAAAEWPRRQGLRLPPFRALAQIDGPGADAFAAGLADSATLELSGPVDGCYLVAAPSATALAEGLAGVPRPAARLRIAVDPAGI
jgi:primosomal protein N' (replication factor Y)